MSNEERRIAPRKECSVPLRFRVIEKGRPHNAAVFTQSAEGGVTHVHFGMLEGQAQNLSERGVYFVCTEKVDVGQEVEMSYRVLNDELTVPVFRPVRAGVTKD